MKRNREKGDDSRPSKRRKKNSHDQETMLNALEILGKSEFINPATIEKAKEVIRGEKTWPIVLQYINGKSNSINLRDCTNRFEVESVVKLVCGNVFKESGIENNVLPQTVLQSSQRTAPQTDQRRPVRKQRPKTTKSYDPETGQESTAGDAITKTKWHKNGGKLDPKTGKPSMAKGAISYDEYRKTQPKRKKYNPKTGKISTAFNAICKDKWYKKGGKVDPKTGEPSTAKNAIHYKAYYSRAPVDPKTGRGYYGEDAIPENAIPRSTFSWRKRKNNRQSTPHRQDGALITLPIQSRSASQVNRTSLFALPPSSRTTFSGSQGENASTDNTTGGIGHNLSFETAREVEKALEETQNLINQFKSK